MISPGLIAPPIPVSLQASSWGRCRSRGSKRPSGSLLATTWPPSCRVASRWSTANPTTTQSWMRTSGLTKKLKKKKMRWEAGLVVLTETVKGDKLSIEFVMKGPDLKVCIVTKKLNRWTICLHKLLGAACGRPSNGLIFSACMVAPHNASSWTLEAFVSDHLWCEAQQTHLPSLQPTAHF